MQVTLSWMCAVGIQNDIEMLQQAAKEGNMSLLSRKSGEKRCAWGAFISRSIFHIAPYLTLYQLTSFRLNWEAVKRLSLSWLRPMRTQ